MCACKCSTAKTFLSANITLGLCIIVSHTFYQFCRSFKCCSGWKWDKNREKFLCMYMNIEKTLSIHARRYFEFDVMQKHQKVQYMLQFRET